MCGKVCVAASRGGVGMGSWVGDALTEMQRSRNAAKESCVAASASVADRRSLVIVRGGLVALSVTCGQDTELAAPCDSRVEADQLVTVEESVVLRANCPCSKSDSTQWCAARSCGVCKHRHENNSGHDALSGTT